MNPMTLRAWLDQAHDDHARQPQAVADALLARAATLPDDAEGAEAVRLGEHLLLAHQADVEALRRLLDLLPPHPALAEARARAAWALQQVGGLAPQAPLPEAEAWRAMQNVLLAWAQRGRADEAAAWLREHEPQAATHADEQVRRAGAATANNLASHLRDALQAGGRGASPARAPADAARAALMLAAAATARRLWAVAGTWLHVERADYQLALCHAAVGDGPAALRHAQACLERCEAEAADALERFFAHEALVHAHCAAGDAAAAGAAVVALQALLPAVQAMGDAGLSAWCGEVLGAATLEAGRAKEKAG
ncbi:MAG: hypothetical protein HY855_10705 [Burkholderiales bacterium]|nr:hypothetical protein [Burkholderiales bacterium]